MRVGWSLVALSLLPFILGTRPFDVVKPLLAFSLLFLGFVALRQNQILYVPVVNQALGRGNRLNPQQAGVPYEDLHVTTSDGIRLHGWLMLQEEARSSITLLYFHGNAGNIGDRVPLFAQKYHALGVNIVAIDYRGYGESQGEPTEAGIKKDAIAALDYVMDHPMIDADKVVLFGRSLGGAVAISLAAQVSRGDRPLHGLIVENSFTSIADMAIKLMPMLLPFEPVLHTSLSRNHWPSIDLIQLVTTPTLFISGSYDELIPPEHMHKLHANAKICFSRLVSIPEGGHNDTPIKGGRQYYAHINDFLTELSDINKGTYVPPQSPVVSRLREDLDRLRKPSDASDDDRFFR